MPTLAQNHKLWDDVYDWSGHGDEWSALWGGTESLWWNTIFPRIRQFLPTGTILEIAPGFGRCTQYLKSYCSELVLVDLSTRCIQACRQRFATDRHITYHVNDGKSLDMVKDGSVDLVFSFDSLVHVEADVMRCYIQQISKKLTTGGVGFIHHSNLGSYYLLTKLTHLVDKAVPSSIGRMMKRAGIMLDTAWRGQDMTADLFDEYCHQEGLSCVTQELINWANRSYLIDSFSTFAASPGIDRVVRRNTGFLNEVRRSRMLCELDRVKTGDSAAISPFKGPKSS
jgi:2-polyprenyl-3-methyl-5-hydroxy-6-metoxy-1,4-benzoquinol methylase